MGAVKSAARKPRTKEQLSQAKRKVDSLTEGAGGSATTTVKPESPQSNLPDANLESPPQSPTALNPQNVPESSRSANPITTASKNSEKRKPKQLTAPHPLSDSSRDLLRSNFEINHSQIGYRIHMRVFEKREDYRAYFYALGKEQWEGMGTLMTDFLDQVVANIDDHDKIATLAHDFGSKHYDFKPLGFKPDFWMAIAHCITIEGCILDGAQHSQGDVAEAWSGIVSVILSNARSGYYDRQRTDRRNTRRKIIAQKTESVTSTT